MRRRVRERRSAATAARPYGKRRRKRKQKITSCRAGRPGERETGNTLISQNEPLKRHSGQKMQKNRIVLDWKYFRVFEYKSEMSEEIPAGICDNKIIGSKGAAKAETVPRSQRRRTQLACICPVMLRRFPLKPVRIAAGNESLWHIGVASASEPRRPGKPASALTATWRKRIVDYHAQARMYVCMYETPYLSGISHPYRKPPVFRVGGHRLLRITDGLQSRARGSLRKPDGQMIPEA